MKYLFGLFIIFCLGSCTTAENISQTQTNHKKSNTVLNSNQITVFGPWGIMYVNSGF